MYSNDFIKFLSSMQIAMEADDITQDTERDLQRTLGGNTEVPKNDDPVNNRPEEDLTKTDDIFGLREDEGAGDQEGPAQNNEDVEDNTDLTEGNDEENTDPNMTTDQTDEPDSFLEDNNNESAPYEDKNKLRDNFINIYKIITGDIDIITSSINYIDDKNSIKTISSVITNLRDLKEIIYNILMKDIEKTEYIELLRKYITIKRIYDINVSIMEKYFSRVEEKNNNKKSKI